MSLDAILIRHLTEMNRDFGQLLQRCDVISLSFQSDTFLYNMIVCAES